MSQAASRRGTSVLFDVFVLNQRVRALLGRSMADAALRPDEYAVYSVVFEFGPITPSSLAARLGMSRTTMSDYVRAMAERRHVRRTGHPRDSRSYLIDLTDAGRRAHRAAARAFEEANRRFRAALPLPEDECRDVLEAIGGAAEEALARLTAESRRAAG